MSPHSTGKPKSTVALFVTCMVDTLYPQVGLAAAGLLERHGTAVVFPENQTCCGQPAFNAGYHDESRRMAAHFIDVFAPLVETGEVDAIVAPSGSCVAMVRHFYAVLFEAPTYANERARVARLSEVTYEVTEYLVDVLDVANTAARYEGTIAYHPCCHLLRELQVDRQPRRLLAAIENVQMIELPAADECCGFGGLFAIKNAEISCAMGQRKVENIVRSGAEVVAVNDVSCMTHINGLLKRGGHTCRAVHIAELLCPEDVKHLGRQSQ